MENIKQYSSSKELFETSALHYLWTLMFVIYYLSCISISYAALFAVFLYKLFKSIKTRFRLEKAFHHSTRVFPPQQEAIQTQRASVIWCCRYVASWITACTYILYQRERVKDEETGLYWFQLNPLLKLQQVIVAFWFCLCLYIYWSVHSALLSRGSGSLVGIVTSLNLNLSHILS